MANITARERFARRFGENIRNERQARSLKLEDLGKLSGVNMTNISKTERGRTVPRLDNAFKLADALGLKLDKLRP